MIGWWEVIIFIAAQGAHWMALFDDTSEGSWLI